VLRGGLQRNHAVPPPLIPLDLHHEYTAPHFDAAMIAATRRWFRRNRTSLAIGAGVIGVGYVAGQYVLGKISEARQRMSEDRIAKEKCECSETTVWPSANHDLVCDAASSRTRRIAHTPSSPYSLLSGTRSSKLCRSSRSPNNYNKKGKSV